MKKEYYIPLEIWTTVNDGVLYCYNIFQRLSDGKYAVQSRDTYDKKAINELIIFFQKQKVTLFIEQDISTRGVFEDTVELSIKTFDESFK